MHVTRGVGPREDVDSLYPGDGAEHLKSACASHGHHSDSFSPLCTSAWSGSPRFACVPNGTLNITNVKRLEVLG